MAKEPSIQEQAAFYDHWNTRYRSGELDDIDPEIRVRGLRVVEKLQAAGVRKARILEVGCGTGWLTGLLVELGTVTAVDLSPGAIDIARDRGIGANFLAADFFTHDFGDDSFDVVVCVETLFYVSEPPRCVEKMARLLRPDGLLGLTAINKFVYERSSDIGPPEPGQVRNWISKGELVRLLEPHFQVLSVVSVAPRGDRGILHLVNSYRVNTVLNRMIGPDRVRRVKERLGLGGGVVILARRR